MFGRWLKALEGSGQRDASGAESIRAALARELPDADAETLEVVTAIAGLLGAVAYADRDFSEAEAARVRAELARVQGITERGIDAIAALLRRHIVEVSTVQTPRYARTLLELGDVELRRDVLGVLVEVAAADGTISTTETNLLRQLTKSLGLSQEDYTELQAQHRERLAVLKQS